MRQGSPQLAGYDDAGKTVGPMPPVDKGVEYFNIAGAVRGPDVDLLQGKGSIAEQDEAGAHAARPTG